jgi:hypothetical protein
MKCASSSETMTHYKSRREMELECDMLRCVKSLPCIVLVRPLEETATLHASFQDALRRRKKARRLYGLPLRSLCVPCHAGCGVDYFVRRTALLR